MKKTLATLFSALSLLIAPAPAFALFNVGQGGTGQSTFPFGAFLYGNGTNPIGATYSPSFSFITATSSSDTSTFNGNAHVGGVLTLGANASLMNGRLQLGGMTTTTITDYDMSPSRPPSARIARSRSYNDGGLSAGGRRKRF